MAGRSRKEEQERILREKRAAAEVGQLGGLAVATVIMSLVYGLFFSKSKFVRFLTLVVVVVGVWWFFGDAIATRINIPPAWREKAAGFVDGVRGVCGKATANIQAAVGRWRSGERTDERTDERTGGDANHPVAVAVEKAVAEDAEPVRMPPQPIEQDLEEPPQEEAPATPPKREPSGSDWTEQCIW